MSGGAGNDNQNGGAGNDRIFANQGVDDDLRRRRQRRPVGARPRDVTPGPNGEVDPIGDTLDGGAGNDTFHTRDGEVDHIDCGDGNDTRAARHGRRDRPTPRPSNPNGLVREGRPQGTAATNGKPASTAAARTGANDA